MEDYETIVFQLKVEAALYAMMNENLKSRDGRIHLVIGQTLFDPLD